jgi:hypothetical protein
MNTRWLVNDSFLDAPPERSAVYEPPDVAHQIEAAFADQIALIGYDAQPQSKQLDLVLHWRALKQPPHAYTVFVHVSDAAGRPVGQRDNMPLRDQWPTSCWQAGEYIGDPYSISLAAEARAPFKVEVGLYRSDTGARLSRSDAEGDSVTLTAP